MNLTLSNLKFKYKIDTNDGTLYGVDEPNFANQIFLNGNQIPFLIYPNFNLHLTYTYNFITNKFSNINANKKTLVSDFDELIIKLFDDLPDKDKQFVYQTILNQVNSYEWSIEKLKVMIITFFSNISFHKYLIADEETNNSMTITTLAKQLGKVIIPIPSKIYLDLNNEEGICTLNAWWGDFYHKYLKQVVSPLDLTSQTQKNNFEYANLFISNILDSIKEIKTLLQYVNIRIIANLPIPVLYLPTEKAIYINQNALENKDKLATNIFIALYYEKLQELYSLQNYGLFWNNAYNLKPLVKYFDDNTNEENNEKLIVNNQDHTENNASDDVNEEEPEISDEQIAINIFRIVDKKINQYQVCKQQAIDLLQKSILTVMQANFPTAQFEVSINENEITINKVLTVVSDNDYETSDNFDNEINFSKIKEELDDIKIGEVVNYNLDLSEIITPIIFREIMDLFINQLKSVNTIIGKVIDGTITEIKLEQGITFVSFNDGNGVLYQSNEIKNEELLVGQTYKFYVEDKNEAWQANEYFLSRNSDQLVKQLFYDNVPALQAGVIQIRNIVRLPGFDTKILLNSNNPNIDPIQMCKGMNKSILHKIEDEIFIPDPDSSSHHEKINLIAYTDDPIALIANVCKPIRIMGVGVVNVNMKKANVIAHQKDVPLLIGKSGINTKLIYQLTGWSISVMNQEEAFQKNIDYVSLNERTRSNENNDQQEATSPSVQEETIDEFNDVDINNEEITEEYQDNDTFVESNHNDSISYKEITDFSELPEFAQLAQEIDNNKDDEQNPNVEASSSENQSENSRQNDDDSLALEEPVNINETLIDFDDSNNMNKKLEQNTNPTIEINDDEDDDDIIHLGQPFLSATKLVQVYRTADGKINEEVPFYLKWLIDSWPWNFNDEEFAKFDCGSVPLKLEFWEQKLIFSIEIKNWTSFDNAKTINCQVLHNNLANANEWKSRIQQLNNQSVNINHWNDFLYVIIVSLKTIEKSMENDPDWKTRNRNQFMPYCNVSIGNYVTVKVNFPGVPEHYKLGSGDLHWIKCWDDLLLSMLNLAAVPMKQIPFQNKHLNFFLQPCNDTSTMRLGWAIIGNHNNYCYLKLESNWMKILIRAIIFMNVFNKCDYKE